MPAGAPIAPPMRRSPTHRRASREHATFSNERVSGDPASESEHFIRCWACGELTDMRDLDGVLVHEERCEEQRDALADALALPDVPFVFLSGHSRHVLPDRHRERPFVVKPYLVSALRAALADLCER
jgi:hypothetical protein